MIVRQDHTLQGGRTIGNYVVTRNLGEGTFGKVKLGTHSITGEKVAIKVLEKSKIADVSDVQRVTRQIHILKQVRHPNVIQLYEIIQTPKQLFLVMEYVSDGELFELIVKKKRLKQHEAVEFFRQLVSGVEYLHQLGIVHRDLKPQNLLIDFSRALKIVDFGLSNTYRGREVLKTACGSPCYAAPEMIAGKRYQGLGADIWSCGVVLFAMICGYLPFQDPNTTVLYKKIIAGDYSIPKFVGSQVREMIQGLLTTDPSRRFTLATIRNHPWFRQGQDQVPRPIGVKVATSFIPVDPQIIGRMEEFNENAQEAKKYVENNRHNHSITIYYLLLKKQLRTGVHSPFDLCSPNFDRNLILRKEQSRKQDRREERKIDLGKQEMRDQSQSTAIELQEIQLDSMTVPAVPRTNRIVSRLSHIRNREARPKEHSIELNLDTTERNFPAVERGKLTGQTKKRPQKILMSRESRQPSEELAFYEIEHSKNKFNQTLAGGWRKPTPSFRTSVNKSTAREPKPREEKSVSERYRSVEVRQRSTGTAAMNRTFMGKIPNAYIPRWQNESERIRSILNQTISGHGKRKQKLNFYS